MDVTQLNQLWQNYQLKVTDEIAKSPEVLFCNGSAIGTLGNFSASTGKAKSKKTFNVSAIPAAALTNGEILRYIAEFPDDKRTILYFDTEQSPHHCQRVMKRALQLAGLPYRVLPSGGLRSTSSAHASLGVSDVDRSKFRGGWLFDKVNTA